MLFWKRQAGPPAPMVSTENHGSQILAIAGFFTSFAFVIVMSRFYVRAIMLHTVGSDDYSILMAMICLIGVFVCFVGEVHLGIGKHINDPVLLANFSSVMEWSWYHAMIIVLGISSVKISVGLFLLRLVEGTRYKRLIIAMIAFLVVFTLACLGTLLFQCLPVRAAWDFTLRPGPPFNGTAKCYSTNTFRSIGLFNGAINIFTDFLFAILPVPIVWNLNVNMRTKVSLVCILSLGFFACGAAIVKEVYLASFFTTPDFTFNDTYSIWNLIELAVGILAACLPALRPLFAFILETATAAVTGSGARSRTGPYVNGSRGRYYMHDDDIKLSSIPSRSTVTKNDTYGVGGVNITTIGLGNSDRSRVYGIAAGERGSGPMSKLEQSIGEDAGSSEENILPRTSGAYEGGEVRKMGIMKTTEVHIT